MTHNGTFSPEQIESSLCTVEDTAEKAGIDKLLRIKLRLLADKEHELNRTCITYLTDSAYMESILSENTGSINSGN